MTVANHAAAPGVSRCPFHAGGAVAESLLSQEALLEPYGFYAALRKQGPVAYLAQQDIWVVTRYDDCDFVLSHPDIFSSREAVSSVNAFRRSSEALAILKNSKAQPRAKTLIMSDPPEHDRYRKIIQRSLAPAKTIRELTPRMQRIIDELIDGFAARGACEFVRDFAYPLPMRVVAAILDVPDDMIDMLKAWSDDFISVQAGNIPDDRIVSAARHNLEFEAFILDKLEARRRNPKDDFLGRLLNQPADEEPLTVPETLNLCLQVLVGGNETTTNFLSMAIHRILTTEGLADQLRSEPERIPDLIEEILRADSPLQGLFRIATRAVELGGVSIPAGAKLMVCFGSANRDETYYGDGEFDPDRDNRANMHLAFGRGIHACAGQGFARREGQLAIAQILKRLPDIRLDPQRPPVRQTLFGFRGMKELPLVFTPTK